MGNISKDKFSSKHEKSKPSSSGALQGGRVQVKVKSFEGEEFTDGYEEFLKQNKPILLEYAAIDEDDEASEQFVLGPRSFFRSTPRAFTCCTASTFRPRARRARCA